MKIKFYLLILFLFLSFTFVSPVNAQEKSDQYIVNLKEVEANNTEELKQKTREPRGSIK